MSDRGPGVSTRLEPRRDRRGRALGLLLAVYLVVLAVFLLLPTSAPASWVIGVGRDGVLAVGVSGDLLTTSRAEFLANVAVFVPALTLAMAVWPRVRWQDCVAYGFLASLSVETVQALVFAGRSATMRDVVANTAGAALGAGLGVWLRRRAPRE